VPQRQRLHRELGGLVGRLRVACAARNVSTASAGRPRRDAVHHHPHVPDGVAGALIARRC
jgi:hypothetical protein